MGRDARGDLPILGQVAHDRLARNLGRSAPIASEQILAAIERLQDLPLTGLQRAADDAQSGFRAWVEDPANAERPFTECPAYVDRIAAESLLERRMFTE